jgi:hypothetical protein
MLGLQEDRCVLGYSQCACCFAAYSIGYLPAEAFDFDAPKTTISLKYHLIICSRNHIDQPSNTGRGNIYFTNVFLFPSGSTSVARNENTSVSKGIT